MCQGIIPFDENKLDKMPNIISKEEIELFAVQSSDDHWN